MPYVHNPRLTVIIQAGNAPNCLERVLTSTLLTSMIGTCNPGTAPSIAEYRRHAGTVQ